MIKSNVTRYGLGILLLGCCLTIEAVLPTNAIAQELKLQIGIIQRLGSKPLDNRQPKIKEVKINSTPGDKLEISFPDAASIPTIKTPEVLLKVESKPLPQGKLAEKLVLSDHSTFETAEASANSWQKLGIEVEIAQPGRWQVWAKREVYSNPLVRRWLLHSLEANGYTSPYLSSQVLTAKPDITLSIEGKEYNYDRVKITTQKNLVKVNTSKKAQSAHLYGGSLELQPNAHGDFTLVNHVPLETYLRGVVPYEIGANAPSQAVAAQTIIARTYALRNLRRFATDDYQLCATVHCQVYKGLTGANSTSDRAIAATQGLVLTHENELIDALYSSTTGGVTAYFEDIWDGSNRPYLQPIIDAPRPIWDLSKYPLANETVFRQFLKLNRGFNETGRSVFRWHKKRSIADLNQDLSRYLRKINHPLANFNTIEALKVHRRSPSGRILTLTVKTDLGKLQLHKNEVRSAFEPPRSTFFYLDPIYSKNKPDKLLGYAFIGGGFGHGVGLSQYGSYNLAKLGWSAAKILAFYYPQTEIKPLDDSIVFWRKPADSSVVSRMTTRN